MKKFISKIFKWVRKIFILYNIYKLYLRRVELTEFEPILNRFQVIWAESEPNRQHARFDSFSDPNRFLCSRSDHFRKWADFESISGFAHGRLCLFTALWMMTSFIWVHYLSKEITNYNDWKHFENIFWYL